MVEEFILGVKNQRPRQGSNLSPHFASAETPTTYNDAPTDPAYNPDTWDRNPPESADLRAIIEAWPELPEAVRTGIIAMVRASGR